MYARTVRLEFDSDTITDTVDVRDYDTFEEARSSGLHFACIRAAKWVVIDGPDGIECIWNAGDNQWRSVGDLAARLHKEDINRIWKEHDERRKATGSSIPTQE